MNTTAVGRSAEAAVAAYFRSRGLEIIDQNWRTRWCEIDVIAKTNSCIIFCEVKYRHRVVQGDGLEAITAAKLRQLHRAAEMWVGLSEWRGDYRLAAASVTAGNRLEHLVFIDF